MAEKSKAAEELLNWQVHLFKKNKVKGIATIVICSISLAVCRAFFDSQFLMLLWAVMLFISVGEFFFPISYRLTTEGAYRKNIFGMKFVPWRSVKRYYLVDDGIKLSTIGKRSVIENFRGIFLRFGDRDELIRRVTECRDRTCGTCGDSAGGA